MMNLPSWTEFLSRVAEWLKATNDPRLIIHPDGKGMEINDVCACCADFCHAMADAVERHERN